MVRRLFASALSGAVAGAVLGILALALAAARTLESGLGVPTVADRALGPSFVVSQAGVYLFVAAAGIVGGALLAMLGYGLGTQADPGAPRYRMAPIAALGAVLGGPAAYAATRAALGLAGDIVEKQLVVTVFRAAVVAAAAGAVVGLLVVITVQRLAHREALGIEGAAVPRSLPAFVVDAATAVLIPAIGLGVGAALVYGLSRVLLESDETVALIVFGGVAALILAGTAFIAARPPKR